jgi:hypothetical protein
MVDLRYMRNILIFLTIGLLLAIAAYVVSPSKPPVESPTDHTTDQPHTETTRPDRPLLSSKALSQNELGAFFPALPEATVDGDTSTYADVSLDENAFSHIERIDVVHDKKAQVRSITLEGLQLTGEIDQNGTINIAGLEDKAQIIAFLLSGAEHISIQNATLSILTKTLGGLSFHANLIAQKQDNGAAVQGTIESRQKNLKFISQIEGVISPSGAWQINSAAEQITFDTPLIRFARGNGQFSIKHTGEINHSPQIAGTFGMGGISLYSFPWQNMAGTLKGTIDEPIINAHMAALGHDGIEADITLDTTGNDMTIGGDIRAHKMSTVIDYITRHNGPLSGNTAALLNNKNETNIELDYGAEGIQSALRDRIVYRVDQPFRGTGYVFLKKPE